MPLISTMKNAFPQRREVHCNNNVTVPTLLQLAAIDKGIAQYCYTKNHIHITLYFTKHTSSTNLPHSDVSMLGNSNDLKRRQPMAL